ncbi:alpha/beta fold hydrolase [Victivallis sp. Marseille-Q1083]|uniref:alpha/beta fold hydrolase n=1 Tax=Victivallis sp. Marseille-Q1083 TaxID=2717288 RepID=UPI00158BE421|nr:alpha/beta hydrolase [Victivallis sp. Marseille-Q1083]
MTVRIHGRPPFLAAAIHGGPGGIGSAAGLAAGLADIGGTLEPLQSGYSIAELVEELYEQLTPRRTGPIALVGHSWGAWLAGIFAARHPQQVDRLILVGCGPLDAGYLPQLEARRQSHFDAADAVLYRRLLADLEQPDHPDRNSLLQQLGRLCEKADIYQPLAEAEPPEASFFDGEMYAKVFAEVADWRKNGKLLETFTSIACPIAVIHGLYDTHPPEGVIEPLRARRVSFSSHLLPQCGHTPWREKYGHDAFFQLLRQLLRPAAARQEAVK